LNREQLEHVLRAATDIVRDADMLVIGSQSVLATFDADELPIEATRSIEVDIAFLDDHDDAKADAIDGAIGELSRFHETYGYYGQGVSVATAVLPEGWEDRLVEISPPRDGARVRSLEVHDAVTSKLVANRQKDEEFATALIEARLIRAETLDERIEALPTDVSDARRAAMRRVVERARRRTSRRS
jgi:hypothetical protein